jgi:CheY-like chemotaxis protein
MHSILVIDDDPEDIALIQQAFTQLGCDTVIFFPSAFEVIKYLKTLNEASLPKLLVTDYNLPTIDGFNLLSFIKRTPSFSSIKVVVITTAISLTEKSRLTDAGVTKIYIKPSSFKEYKKITEELISLAAN